VSLQNRFKKPSTVDGAKRLLSADESAGYFGIHVKTFRKKSAQGLLPKPVRIVGIDRVMWDKLDLDRFIDRQKSAA